MNAFQSIPQDVLPAGSKNEGLRAEFEWLNDRFVHRIVADIDGKPQIILQTTEGDDEQIWPPSPALQQLSIEPMPDDRRAALAVGMSGRSHFSISVEADRITPRLSYDVACRYIEQPSFIGSCYRILGATHLVDETTVEVVRDGIRLRIQVIPDGDSVPKISVTAKPPELNKPETESAGEEHSELRIEAPTATAPATVRWLYSIELA